MEYVKLFHVIIVNCDSINVIIVNNIIAIEIVKTSIYSGAIGHSWVTVPVPVRVIMPIWVRMQVHVNDSVCIVMLVLLKEGICLPEFSNYIEHCKESIMGVKY